MIDVVVKGRTDATAGKPGAYLHKSVPQWNDCLESVWLRSVALVNVLECTKLVMKQLIVIKSIKGKFVYYEVIIFFQLKTQF